VKWTSSDVEDLFRQARALSQAKGRWGRHADDALAAVLVAFLRGLVALWRHAWLPLRCAQLAPPPVIAHAGT
jgi:hypothetical protein